MWSESVNTKVAGCEASGAGFGDARLSERFVLMARAAARHPAASFPRMFSTVAELEAGYRFFGNPKTDWEAMLTPHFEGSAKRIQGLNSVIVAHDTSEFKFPGDEPREGLGYLRHGKGQGFYGHFSILVAERNDHMPLGLTHTEAIVRKYENRGRKRSQREVRDDPAKESLKWRRGVDSSMSVLAEYPGEVVHVMDREADDYELLTQLLTDKRYFVIRSSTNRVIDGDDKSYLHDELRAVPGTICREVPLSKRRREPSAENRKKHPPRERRKATLAVSSLPVWIKRPKLAKQSLPEMLQLNAVRVHEVSPPEGEEPVEWILLTNLEAEATAQMERVIDCYRARWRIEEFFKALKTGCSYEKRQLETADALFKALALLAPIAWQLLVVRTLAHTAPNEPARLYFSPLRIEILRRLCDYKLPEEPTYEDMLWAIARFGGHLKQNGPPGWQTLGRGMERLLEAEHTTLAMKDVINC